MKEGFELPPLTPPPVDRTTLALFAGASGDHNPIHIDLDVARAAGMPDVFAQGMLGMAWLGRLLTGWVPQSRLRRFDVRFQGITQLGDAIRCEGRVVEQLLHEGEPCARVEISSRNQQGQARIVGEALVALEASRPVPHGSSLGSSFGSSHPSPTPASKPASEAA